MIGPVLIYDKSFLYSLNTDEASLLHKIFTTNITPVLFIEVIENLEGESKYKNKTSKQSVSHMANKLPILNYNINASYDILVRGELINGNKITMEKRPIDSAIPMSINTADGQKGLYCPETEAEKAIHFWREGKFSELDSFIAKLWQNQKSFDLNKLSTDFKKLLPNLPNFKDLNSLKSYVEKILDTSSIENPIYQIELISKRFIQNQQEINSLLYRYRIACEIAWETENKFLHPKDFIPYSYYIYLVEFTYIVAISQNLIDTHKKSKSHIDLQYLFYLPFCMSFISNDNTHEKLVPLFISKNQNYVKGTDVKKDLQTILERLKTLSKEDKEIYTENHPTVIGDSTLGKIFDFHSNSWRQKRSKSIKLTPEQERKIIEEFKIRKEAIKNGTLVNSLSNDNCDFVIKVRKMTASQIKREFNLSQEHINKIINKTDD